MRERAGSGSVMGEGSPRFRKHQGEERLIDTRGKINEFGVGTKRVEGGGGAPILGLTRGDVASKRKGKKGQARAESG